MNINADGSTSPSVFVSYSHDSLRHKARVLELSNRLRAEGIKCEIDAYYEAPPERWPRWMLNQVESADYVLVICTESYEHRFRGKDRPGEGKGAKWEGVVITQQLYDAEVHNTRFIPVLFESSDEAHIPIVLRGTTYYDVSTESGYARLYRRITAQPEIDVPAVADTIRQMPPKDISAEQRLVEAREKREQAQAEIDRNNFEVAAILLREAANLARIAADPESERKAVLGLVRTLGEQASSNDVEESERRELVADIHKNIDRLEQLGERPAAVALEKALAARLEGDAEGALAAAEQAISFGDDDLSLRTDALIARLQALWQLGRPVAALDLSKEVENVRSQAEDDPSLCLDASWIRTLCKAGKMELGDLERFTENVRAIASRGDVSRERIAFILGEVEAEFGRANLTEERLLLCELAYEIMEPLGDRQRLISVLMEAAELSALLGNSERARVYLGRADSWVAQRGTTSKERDEQTEATVEAMRLFARARIITRLADRADSPFELYQEAYKALNEAKDFANNHEASIRGDIGLYLADLCWWLGRTAINLGRLEEGAHILRSVRSDASLANPRFAFEVGVKAWTLEAEALALSGHLSEAVKSIEALITDSRITEEAKARPRAFRRFLGNIVQPTVEWFDSAEAQRIQRVAKERGLRTAVSDQLVSLVSWWKEWEGEPGSANPHSELLDFWGRGGFTRIAAAVRAKPHAAIAVDATTIDEIRRWARILCPLFETVIVKWKGELGSGLVIAPIHADYGGSSESFGGHGYSVTAGSRLSKPDWYPALSWANPLPRALVGFLAGEALPMFRSGRLVVFPASLVGCTQTAVGWTDTLLVERLLGGVVNVARAEDHDSAMARRQRVLDVSRIQIPFIDNVALADLASVLDETERWIAPLRGLLLRTMSNEDLNYERWDRVAALEYDIQQACQELREHLSSLASRHSQHEWTIADATGGISAGERGGTPPANEPITGLLQSVSLARRDLSPWIPYLRLQDCGGYLNWTCALDNPSTPADPVTLANLAGPKGPELHTWLYPGTGGWGIPSAIRIPIDS